MRRLIVVILAACTLAAAPGPTEAYLAARDKALQTYLHPTPADDARAANVVAALDSLIAAAVGPIALPGFPPKGKGNVDSLSPEMGYGKLDGVKVSSGRTEVLVSNQALLHAWLEDARFWDGAERPGFGSAGFLTAALRNDAAVMPSTALPVVGSDASALLFQYAQDNVGANPPDRIGVFVLRGDRVYVFVTEVKVAAAPACTAAFKKDSAAVDALMARYQNGGAKDEALFDRATKAADAASTKAQACIADQLKTNPAWAGLVGTAQHLVDIAAPR